MTNTQYYKEVNRVLPVMKILYRLVRCLGVDRKSAKEIIETSLKCAMIDETFEGGIDKE